MDIVVNEKKLLNDETPSIDIYDLDYLEARMNELRASFPEPFFQHTLAIKVNPMRGILKHVLKTGFMGAECASIGEVLLSIQCGFPADQVVYDSPVKSKASSILTYIIIFYVISTIAT